MGGAGMLNLVLSLSLSYTGHWKFNMAPHGKELSEDLKKRIVALHKDGVGYKKIAKTLKLSCSTKFAYLVSVWQPQRTDRLPKRELVIWNNSLSTRKVRDWVTRCPVFPGSYNSLWFNLVIEGGIGGIAPIEVLSLAHAPLLQFSYSVHLLYLENEFNLYFYQKIKMNSSFSKFNPWFKFLIYFIDLV